ncbi:hypothetical protein SSBG_02130 [Streptomyces sp. SPB074]|nr:hypothetical protein SSBG_02130 [Streptomyces sp. SPB074]
MVSWSPHRMVVGVLVIGAAPRERRGGGGEGGALCSQKAGSGVLQSRGRDRGFSSQGDLQFCEG